MAPSVRDASARASKRQPLLHSFGKISKPSVPNPVVKSNAKKISALEDLLNGEKRREASTPKRKRDDSDDEDFCTAGATAGNVFTKKAKLAILTPPTSQPSTDDERISIASVPKLELSAHLQKAAPAFRLPDSLLTLLSLHEHFLKAFSIHVAHNGCGSPAELSSLLKTITRLYKKHAVQKADIQRMLAIYEIETDDVVPRGNLTHERSPFRLVTSGIGPTSRTCVEYVRIEPEAVLMGQRLFREEHLHSLYKAQMRLVAQLQQRNLESFINGPLTSFPLLACNVGAQTAIRKEAASTRRDEILRLSSQAQRRSEPSFSKLSINDDEPQAPQAVKARTLSLFDRVKAKQLATSSTSTSTADAITRQHAVGRIAEVVEILRMKQQQKLSARYRSSIHSSPSKVQGKVSFSYGQIVGEIKGSASVPIADEEAKMCIEILAKEVPGMWLTIFEVGSMRSIVLNGAGPSGAEAKRMISEKSGV